MRAKAWWMGTLPFWPIRRCYPVMTDCSYLAMDDTLLEKRILVLWPGGRRFHSGRILNNVRALKPASKCREGSNWLPNVCWQWWGLFWDSFWHLAFVPPVSSAPTAAEIRFFYNIAAFQFFKLAFGYQTAYLQQISPFGYLTGKPKVLRHFSCCLMASIIVPSL